MHVNINIYLYIYVCVCVYGTMQEDRKEKIFFKLICLIIVWSYTFPPLATPKSCYEEELLSPACHGYGVFQVQLVTKFSTCPIERTICLSSVLLCLCVVCGWGGYCCKTSSNFQNCHTNTRTGTHGVYTLVSFYLFWFGFWKNWFKYKYRSLFTFHSECFCTN